MSVSSLATCWQQCLVSLMDIFEAGVLSQRIYRGISVMRLKINGSKCSSCVTGEEEVRSKTPTSYIKIVNKDINSVTLCILQW